MVHSKSKCLIWKTPHLASYIHIQSIRWGLYRSHFFCRFQSLNPSQPNSITMLVVFSLSLSLSRQRQSYRLWIIKERIFNPKTDTFWSQTRNFFKISLCSFHPLMSGSPSKTSRTSATASVWLQSALRCAASRVPTGCTTPPPPLLIHHRLQGLTEIILRPYALLYSICLIDRSCPRYRLQSASCQPLRALIFCQYRSWHWDRCIWKKKGAKD